MARAGMGEPFIITRAEDADKIANKFRNYISSPVLTQISYDIAGFDVYDVEPATIPDVFAERPVLLFGKWRGDLDGEITVNGIVCQGQKYSKTISVSDYRTADKNRGLKYLWARYKIALLADYNQVSPNDERVTEITNLGLTYNLLTEYTSFIAADTQVRNQSGQTTTVQQPLPLPNGVSGYAVVSGSAGSGGYKSLKIRSSSAAPREELMDISEVEHEKNVIQLDIRVDIQTENLEKHKSELEKQVKTYKSVLEYCNLKFNTSGVAGIIKFQVTLNNQNQIIEVKVINNSTKNIELAKCLAKKINELNLKSPDKTKDVTFIVELNFGY
jgi:Ca-activated chloride channel family protein